MFNFFVKKLIYFVIISLFLPTYFIYSATTETKESLNSKITDIAKQIEALDKEIAQYQNQITITSQESKTLANLIKELNLTRSKLLKEEQQTESKIKLTNNTIVNLEENIGEKNNAIKTTQSVLKKSLYELYQNDQTSLIELLLMEDGLQGMSREYQDRLALSKRINSFIDTTKQVKLSLEETKNKKEIEHKNLSSLKSKLVQEKKAVDIVKSEKDKVLKETKNKEEEYKKILAQRQKARDDFEKEFRDYESKLKFLLDPKLLPGSGALSWPLEKILVTQLFGKTSSSGRLYASGSHSGVDFRASVGTPVYAMASGTVLGTGDTDLFCKGASFGKWVFIQYNNGLSSTYGHLSAISAKKNQEVKAGDLVGYSGNTGHSTGPHLHVSVYASQGAQITEFPSKSCPGANFVMPVAPITAYLDPMLYLPKLSSGMLKK